MMKNRKILIIAVAFVIISAVLAGSVFAILKGVSNKSDNAIVADQDSDPTVTETFDNNVKSNVKIKVGDNGYSVFVRAMIVVNWQKTTTDGETYVYNKAPVEGVDYSINLNVGDDWTEKGGIYYYKDPVVSNGSTGVLINTCEELSTPPEGYKLHVEILTQTIQAIGYTDSESVLAMIDAWSTVEEGEVGDWESFDEDWT